jgi:methionyl-tRNA synthetase
MSREKFYLTTPIFYPNGKPHIGHAYTVIASDALARFQRLDGKDVFFLSGTDEHGLKMQQTAEKEGITPKALADRNSAIFRSMIEAVGGSNDEFIRTTEPRHYESCRAIWKAMAANGDIYLDRYVGGIRCGRKHISMRPRPRSAMTEFAATLSSPVDGPGRELFLSSVRLSGRVAAH